MSTKIYDAYKIAGRLTLEGLNNKIQHLKKDIEKITYKELYTVAARHAAFRLDKLFFENHALERKYINPSDKDVLANISAEIGNEMLEIKNTGKRNPDIDFCFEACIIPTEHKDFIKFFIERQSFRALLDSQDWLIEYDYWDNTDKPESVTMEEWNQRETDWDEAIGNNSWDKSGMIIDLSVPDLYFRVLNMTYYSEDVEGVIAALPSYDDRVSYHVKRALIDHIAKDIQAKDKELGDMQSVIRAVDRVDDPIYADVKARITSDVYKIIPKEITKTMLGVSE